MVAVAERPDQAVAAGARLEHLPLELVDVGANVRVDTRDIEELAATIREHGVLQPVRAIGPDAAGRYRLVWGQRRLLASKIAGALTIPALVESDADVAEPGSKRSLEQLVENIARADLNPLEEAEALRAILVADPSLTQADLAARVGRSAPWVANTLGLLEAPREIQAMVRDNELTASHARALKGLDAKAQVHLGNRAVKEASSAHQLEREVQAHKRSEEWQRERREADRKSVEARRAAFTAAIAKLETKKVAKSAPIRVVDHGGGSAGHIVDLVKKAGFTDVATVTYYGVASRSAAAGCDCTAWKMESRYESVTVAPACISSKHQQAKTKVDDDKRRAKYALEERVHKELAALGPNLATPDAGGIVVNRLAARMALWHALGYRVADWAEKRGGKRGNPWPTIAALDDNDLAASLGAAVAGSFRDNYGYHIPWPEIAAELGIALDEPKPAKAKKAAAKP